MAHLFVSYRRDDSAAEAGRLADGLAAHASHPTVFFDTEAIAPGDPWRQRIDDALAHCDIMLVVIGPHWLDTAPGSGRPRLFDAGDVQAYEIAAALKRRIRTIPILVAGATLPVRAQLPETLSGLLDANALEIRTSAFARDLRALEAAILPRPWRRVVLGGLGLAVVVGIAAWGLDQLPPVFRHEGRGGTPATEAMVDLDIAFTPNPLMSQKFGGIDNGLRAEIDEPERIGPLLLVADGERFVNRGFRVPRPGSTLVGELVRNVPGAVEVTEENKDLIFTTICLDVARTAPPSNGRLRLACEEGRRCSPEGDGGIARACGATGAGAFQWMPTAMAQETAVAKSPPRPQPGDWIVPQLSALQRAATTPQAAAYSEVTLTLPTPPAGVQADEVTYELTVNRRRLWVDGMASWTHAQAFDATHPLTLTFGLENLDASGANHGQEKVDVRIVLLAHRRPVHEDACSLNLVALRTIETRTISTLKGLEARWAATYHAAPQDRFQVFAFGGNEARTLAAKASFDALAIAASAKSDAGRLVGVVRPPNRSNTAWGLAIGEVMPSGQIRFSYSANRAAALCQWVGEGRNRERLAKAFDSPGKFRVREIATAVNDDAPKAMTACNAFSAP